MAKDKQVNTSAGFSTWLENVTEQYAQLKDEEKNDTLDRLVAVSGPSQLYCLLKKMDILLYRDFLKLLPMELAEYLLKFLDGKTLMKGCQVSRAWNRKISSLPRVWQQACINAGYIIDQYLDNRDANYWKTFFVEMNTRRHHMKTYRSFFSKTYDRDLRRLTAVFYYKGKVAAASESKIIRIWDCASDRLISVLRTDFSISAIKFDEEYLVASSYLGYLVLWNIQTGCRMYEFMRHTGAVFTFDFSVPLKLIVSGAADNKVKFWSITNARLYKTLADHNLWVIKVSLTPYPAEEGSEHQNQHLLLSMDKCCIWVRLVSSMPVKSSRDGLYLRPLYAIPLESTHPNAYVPGVYFDGTYIYYMKHLDNSSSFAVFCQWDVKNRQLTHKIDLQHKAKALLAVGSKYIAVLKPYECKNTPNFTVIDRETLEKVAFWHLPVSRPMTPEAAGNYSFGESAWLDGLDGQNDNGVVLAVGTDENSVYLLSWIPR